MLNSTLRRSALVTGTIVTTGALALTCASTAGAAPVKPKPVPPGSTATAQVLSASPLGQPAQGSPVVTASNNGTQTVQTSTSAQAPAALPLPVNLTLGGVGATAVARQNQAYACAGLLQPGGTLSLGNDGADCNQRVPTRGGLVIGLGGVLKQLPIGVGTVQLSTNAVIAYSKTTTTGTTGFAKIVNPHLKVCLGQSVPGTGCVGQLIDIPIKVIGGENADLVPTILKSLTKNAQLGALGQTLADLLRPVLSVKTNVQSTSNGVFKVVGLQVGVLGGAGGSADLAVATSKLNS